MTISLCLMVRNEKPKLAACLQSATDLVDEAVVVDTGSTDGTRELAAKLGARVFEFPWVDDFAAARTTDYDRQANGRVAGAVARPGSHKSVRAQLRHTARQVTGWLTRRHTE
jgi:GT2 family glycosyltransferase